ncbi:MAG TPA: TIGR03619 family F420-dependent LLM class oxidoreductase [Candidatus Dormibacteraeota bacterium]|nr:TIGR03619 family F420-dependent LLM class oxidoreductase [Candidatus Dormibacteraeota bacterium]
MRAPIRIGAKLPHSGELAMRVGPARMAADLDEAGFDSIWVSDHVVFPYETTSRYPFAANGRPTWPFSDPYLEPLIVLGAVAAATSRAALGTSVLIAPMRNPVLMAKQAATIDALSGGRLVLGVGVGWLREEFEALDADFAARGEVLDEWIEIMRACWTGSAGPFEGRHYRLPAAIHCRPAPEHGIPLLVGGMSRHAIRRAGVADGWLGQYALETISERDIAAAVESMGSEEARVVVRVTGAAEHLDKLALRLGAFAGAGVTEVIVDVNWKEEAGPERAADLLRNAAART